MELAGMHWTRLGLKRCWTANIHVNGDWDEYQTFRIDHATQKLYPWRELVEGAEYQQAA